MVRDSYEKCSESIQFFSSDSESLEGKRYPCLLSYLPSIFVKDHFAPLQIGKLKHIWHPILYVWMAQSTKVTMTARSCSNKISP